MTALYSRIVIRRSPTRTEIIGRAGHVDPHAIARALAPHGKVTVVRHVTMGSDGQPETVAIHHLK